MTGPIVVDASVIIRWLLGGPVEEMERAGALLDRYEGRLAAPSVFVTEVLGRISGHTKATGPARLDPQAALLKAQAAWGLDVDLFPPDPREDTGKLLLYGRNLSVPDASYVLLAERLETVLYTFDRRLIDGVQKLGLGQLAVEPPPV